jgi:hypothetical protein
MTRTTGNSASGRLWVVDCVKDEALGSTVEDAGEHVRVRSSILVELKAASPVELLLESVCEEPETDSESVTFWRTPRTPEQSAATCVVQ